MSSLVTPIDLPVSRTAPGCEAPVRRPLDTVMQRWAFADQFEQIDALRHAVPERAADWRQREIALVAHIAALSPAQVRQAAMRAWRGWLNVPRRLLMSRVIHPTPRGSTTPNKALVDRCIWQYGAQREVFWSGSAQLEGLLLRGRQRQRQPVLIVSTPNRAQAEDLLGTPTGPLNDTRPLLQTVAEELGIDILLYNGRGIGGSLGREWSTHDGVRDAEAALMRALELSQTEPAVIGISLGAGYLARGIRRLQEGQVLGPQGIGLFSSYHSFTSIIGAAVGGYGGLSFTLLRGLAMLLHIDQLDVFAALKAGPLARATVVARPTHENQLSGDGQALPPINALYRPEIRCVDGVGACHGDLTGIRRNAEYYGLLREWAEQAGGALVETSAGHQAGYNSDELRGGSSGSFNATCRGCT